MDKETLKYFIEYKFKVKNVTIDDFCLGNGGWQVQVVWRPKPSAYFGEDQCANIFYVEEFFDWKNKIYLRRQKLKEICSKLKMK